MGSLSSHLVDVHGDHGRGIDLYEVCFGYDAGKAVPGVPLAQDFQEFEFSRPVRLEARPAEADNAVEGGSAIARAFGMEKTLESIHLETNWLTARQNINLQPDLRGVDDYGLVVVREENRDDVGKLAISYGKAAERLRREYLLARCLVEGPRFAPHGSFPRVAGFVGLVHCDDGGL